MRQANVDAPTTDTADAPDETSAPIVELGGRFISRGRLALRSAQDETRREVAQRVRRDAGYDVTDAILDVPN